VHIPCTTRNNFGPSALHLCPSVRIGIALTKLRLLAFAGELEADEAEGQSGIGPSNTLYRRAAGLQDAGR
jgi:hypothetical protein